MAATPLLNRGVPQRLAAYVVLGAVLGAAWAPPARAQAPGEPSADVAIMPFDRRALDSDLSDTLTDTFQIEFSRAVNRPVMGSNDLAALIGFEKQKELLGCDAGSCLAEIGGSLGVRYIVFGRFARVGKTYLVTVKMMDSKFARLVAQDQESVRMPEGDNKDAREQVLLEGVQALARRFGKAIVPVFSNAPVAGPASGTASPAPAPAASSSTTSPPPAAANTGAASKSPPPETDDDDDVTPVKSTSSGGGIPTSAKALMGVSLAMLGCGGGCCLFGCANLGIGGSLYVGESAEAIGAGTLLALLGFGCGCVGCLSVTGGAAGLGTSIYQMVNRGSSKKEADDLPDDRADKTSASTDTTASPADPNARVTDEKVVDEKVRDEKVNGGAAPAGAGTATEADAEKLAPPAAEGEKKGASPWEDEEAQPKGKKKKGKKKNRADDEE